MAQPIHKSTKRVVVVDVPYQQYMRPEEGTMAAAGFSRCATALRGPGGSILKQLFQRLPQLKGLDIHSVTLIGFSAGTVFVNEVMKGSDAEWVDTVISLDGTHLGKNWSKTAVVPSEVAHWIEFAKKAARGERMLVIAHTHVAPLSDTVTSSTETANLIHSALESWATYDSPDTTPVVKAADMARLLNFVATHAPPPEVSITAQKRTKRYAAPPLFNQTTRYVGNAWFLDYGGTEPADHVYVAWYGQRDIWEGLLLPRLEESLVCARPPSTSGFGWVAECQGNRAILDASVYPTDVSWRPGAVMFGGLLAGTCLGYLVGRIV